ncbi:hypothetical protein MIR68_002732 [Amoeboaphelidium protococcarum]|nr:hypothetical protein MIR68_002732 [Amoeboaphelidium protococcarum]
MLNVSYALCGAHTVCWYVGPRLVSFFLYNHSLVLSRPLKQSRWAALLHLALSTAYSTGMVSFTHHGIGLSCNSLSSIQCKLVLCFFAIYMLKVKCLAEKELYYAGTPGMIDGLVSQLFLILLVRSDLISMAFQRILPLSSAASVVVSIAPVITHLASCTFTSCANSQQLTGADGSTQSHTAKLQATFRNTNAALYTFDYLLYYVGVACGNHTYLLASITVSVSCLCSKYVPTEVRPVTVGPLKGALCLIIYSYPTALLLAVLHTWTLPRLLAVLHTWVVCLSVLSVS